MVERPGDLMSTLLANPVVLEQWVRNLWLIAGSNAREAQLTATHLVQANLSGHDSHGVQMIVPYIDSLLAGGLQLNQSVQIEIDSPSLLKVNGQRGMGQAVTEQAMAMAIERAQQTGICLLGLHNAHHLGRVGHWAEQAIAGNCASVHFTNVRATALVAPFGGAAARFVTNPFTIGIPRANKTPLLLDFATSAIAAGKVRVAMNKGASVAPGNLIDSQGLATTNPAVLFDEPLGALLTAAGHKGYGLAVMCELLAAALLGEPTLRTETIPDDFSIINNMLAIVFDPAKMGALQNFNVETDHFEQWLKSTPLAPGHQSIELPGEAEMRHRTTRANGIPLDLGAILKLDEAAQKLFQAKGNKASASAANFKSLQTLCSASTG
jgi:hydroxycarboxylate dehydrogenase B